MEKYFVLWNGKKFPVRTVVFPIQEGFDTPINVADIDLWFAIEEEYSDGNVEANAIDNDIYYYCNNGFIESDPTDEEIVDYLIKHGC